MTQTDTKKQIIELAKGYLQDWGFNSFSFQTIADALGIQKPSVHYHFKSKEALGLALIEDYNSRFTYWKTTVEGLDSRLKITKFFEIFEKLSGEKTRVCPAGVLTADFNTIPQAMQDALLMLHENQKSWLTETLKQGKKEKLFREDLKIDVAVDLIMSSIQGGMQIARLRKDKKLFVSITKNLKDFVLKFA